jgi:hypothetical protein
VEWGLLCRLLNPTGNIEWAAIYHEDMKKDGREGKRANGVGKGKPR